MININYFPINYSKKTLSIAQERIWFLQQIQPGIFGYNVYRALKLKGLLNIRALEETLNQIIQRHKSLQATFPFTDGNPNLVLIQPPYRNLEIVDLKQIPYQLRESETERLMTAAVRVPFDLTKWPLLRLTLFRLSKDESIILIILHQIICDTYSIEILLNEIIDVYQTISTGASLPHPVSPNVYSDFSGLPPHNGSRPASNKSFLLGESAQ